MENKLDADLRDKTIWLLCERKAKSEKVVLPEKAWSHPDWKKFWVSQAQAYSSLYKIYPQQAIYEAVVKESWLFSLRNKKIDKTIQEICKRVNKQLAEKPVVADTKIEYRKTRSSRSKWTDLDGDTNG